jgi:enamine deaminase RidA (YjgF/YER057c/UK114 family)
METIAEKLKRMGLDLPKAAAPAGSYVPIGRCGNALFIAGQIGVQQRTGSARLGAELGVEEGRAAATAAGLAVLAQIAAGTDGRVSTRSSALPSPTSTQRWRSRGWQLRLPRWRAAQPRRY